MIAFSAEKDARALTSYLRTSSVAKLLADGPLLPAEKVEKLAAFAELVSTWGQRTDLVSAPDMTALFEVLFLDAIAMSAVCSSARMPSLVTEGEPPSDAPGAPGLLRVVDVGAGAGAPAIPFAILRDEVHMTLLEPRRRRVMFMRTAVGALGLRDRVEVLEGRLDTDAPEATLVFQTRQPFDYAMSRATFAPELWLQYGMKIAPVVWLFLGQAAPPCPERGRAEGDDQQAGATGHFRLAERQAYQTAGGSPRSVARYNAQEPPVEAAVHEQEAG